jgi:hypothetical protein
MKPSPEYRNLPMTLLPIIILLLAFTTNCATHARGVVVHTPEKSGTSVPAEEYEADEFIGVPIVGDYDDDPALDFMIEVRDADRTFKVEVHEDVNDSNREAIDRIRNRINQMEDEQQQLRVIGYYSPEYRGKNKEYGFMDLKCVIFFDKATGYEEAFFTDAKESRFYDDGDVTVIYAPGHHYSSVYYPRYSTPWWDTDGDGIPDRYDPWPMTYDTWYDYNFNGVPDWYDPYYCSYYPYWNHWNMGFWVSYDWYSPRYFRHGYLHDSYYSDYRTYSRLYDRQYVSKSRKHYNLDPKSARFYRTGQDRDRRADSRPAVSGGRDYSSLPTDRRRLISTGGETALNSNGETQAVRTNNDPRTFSRNRAVAEPAGTASSGRVSGTQSGRRKTSGTNTSSTVRGVDRARTSGTGTVSRSGSTSDRSRSSGDNRVYKPADSNRSGAGAAAAGSSGVVTGKTKTRTPDSGRSTRPNTSRSTRTDSRYRESGSSGTSKSTPSRSRNVRSSSSKQRSSVSPSSSSRSTSRPAARSSSRSRSSSPAPAARSSSGSSRSRSSGSSSKSSSSSSSSRRRK